MQFRKFEETAKFIKHADNLMLENLYLEMFVWIDLCNFEMQLVELQSSSIWKQKFINLRAELETVEQDQLTVNEISV
jgi:hypothetical protein